MKECVIDQLRMCIVHMLRLTHNFSDNLNVYLHNEIIEKRDNALFFKSELIGDALAKSYVIFDNTFTPRSRFNGSDILFQNYLTKAKIAFTIEPEYWTILSFDEAYKLLALLKLEGY